MLTTRMGWLGACVLLGHAPLAQASEVQLVSPTHLLFTVETTEEAEDLFDREAWTVDFSGQTLDVTEITSVVRPRPAASFGEAEPDGVGYLIKIDGAMQAGDAYVFRNGDLSWYVVVDEAEISPSIKVNQVGYLPGLSRWAYVSAWLPELDPIAAGGQPFHVVDEATGDIVLQHALVARTSPTDADDALGENYGGAFVHEADLSDLTEPGTYRIVWEGVGSSPPFTIGDDVYEAPFETVFRALYHQRCGVELTEDLTDWPRDACHTGEVSVTSANVNEVGLDGYDTVEGSTTGDVWSAVGGYHDGHDYHRHGAHLEVVRVLVGLYELAAGGLDADDLGIPESANGLPDVLDEALWGARLFADLQDSEGGVPGGLQTTGPASLDTLPTEDSRPWYAFASDARTSYQFAAAAASLARVLEDLDEDEAEAWLDAAELAWNWAEGRKPSYDVDDVALYAAAELHRTTRAQAYADTTLHRGPFADDRLDAVLSNDDAQRWMPAMYAMALDEDLEPEVREAAQRLVIEQADNIAEWAEANAMRFAKDPYAAVGAGSLTSPRQAEVLFRAHHLTGEQYYLELGAATCDGTLGSNWSGRSWVTGLGWDPVVMPAHPQSLNDGLEEPVPGLVVYGPDADTEGSDGLASAAEVFVPPLEEWPAGERYTDIGSVPEHGGLSVDRTLAPTLFAFGYLAHAHDAEEQQEEEEDDDDDDDDDFEDDDGPPGPQGGPQDADPNPPGPVDTGPTRGCTCTTGGGLGGTVPLAWLLVALIARRRARSA